jgi:hypothetical protein
MNSNLDQIIIRICSILNKHSVQYLIVGGSAVALHGYFRDSINQAGLTTDKPDLDCWYNPTYDNYFRLLDALEDLGEDVREFKDEQTPNPKASFFKFQFQNFTLDLLPQLKTPLNFFSSYVKKEIVNLEGIPIPFINIEDLIKDKKGTARKKDMDDLRNLRKSNLD